MQREEAGAGIERKVFPRQGRQFRGRDAKAQSEWGLTTGFQLFQEGRPHRIREGYPGQFPSERNEPSFWNLQPPQRLQVEPVPTAPVGRRHPIPGQRFSPHRQPQLDPIEVGFLSREVQKQILDRHREDHPFLYRQRARSFIFRVPQHWFGEGHDTTD